MPRVLISYTHDTPEHMDRVWNLSERLREDGIDCRIDQHEESPAEGWPRWCLNQIEESQFVLVACTETYLRRYRGKEEPGKGKGGNWEGLVITQELYNSQGKNTKFIPIVFFAEDSQFIPLELQGSAKYKPGSDEGYEDLLRRLTDQPRRKPSPVANEVRLLPTKEGRIPAAAFAASDGSPTGERPLPKLERKMPSAPLFTVPIADNPFFTERGHELAELEQTLKKRGIAALTGMGGMGKTQTAAKYAYLHREEYPAVLWVRAENQETLYADFSLLAKQLGLEEADAQEQKLVVEAVKRWLDDQPRWLLVLDNVVELDFEDDLIRKADLRCHHIIVTTQSEDVGGIDSQDLPLMSHDTGALLLLRRAGKIASDAPLASAQQADIEAARQISATLGGLPLAIDQAGAYIKETKRSLADYYQLMQERLPELLTRRGKLDFKHQSVAKTFLESLEQLKKRSPAAADLVRATAFLSPDAIPEEIFTEGASKFAGPLQAVAADAVAWDEAIGATLIFSLLDRDPDKKTLSVHRTVQIVVRWSMKDEEQRDWAEQVIRAVDAAYPGGTFDIRDWPRCERLLAHAQACASFVDEFDISSVEAGLLLIRTGYYLYGRARFQEAEPLYRRAIAIDEKAYGPDHPEVATALNNLALLLKTTNRLAEAEPLYHRALAIDEKALGPDHPNVAIRLNNLAELLRVTSRYTEAEPLIRRALAIWEKSLGPEHPQVATGLNNLANLLQDTNRLAEAEPLMRRVVAILDKSHGPDHPNVAAGLNNLAALLQATNRLAEAEPLMRRALAIAEKAYGPDHPDVAIDLNNLAQLLQATNRLAEAEPLYRRALAIFEKSLGADHPSTITVRNNLEALLRARAAES